MDSPPFARKRCSAGKLFLSVTLTTLSVFVLLADRASGQMDRCYPGLDCPADIPPPSDAPPPPQQTPYQAPPTTRSASLKVLRAPDGKRASFAIDASYTPSFLQHFGIDLGQSRSEVERRWLNRKTFTFIGRRAGKPEVNSKYQRADSGMYSYTTYSRNGETFTQDRAFLGFRNDQLVSFSFLGNCTFSPQLFHNRDEVIEYFAGDIGRQAGLSRADQAKLGALMGSTDIGIVFSNANVHINSMMDVGCGIEMDYRTK